MMRPLEGKVAIVTGSSQGIGAAIARRFAEAGAGGIVLCGRNAGRGRKIADALAAAGAEAFFVPANLSRVADCRRVVAAAERRFGRVDALINAAGLSSRGTLLDTSERLFDDLFAVNCRAPFFMMQSVADLMRRTGIKGTILNIISVASHGGPPNLIAYSASKAALAAMTRSAAYSLLPDNIRVNGLNIGWTKSDGEDAVQKGLGGDDDWADKAAARLPFGRLIEPDEVAAMAVVLNSATSGLMTGSVVDFDQTVPGCRTSSPPPERLPDPAASAGLAS